MIGFHHCAAVHCACSRRAMLLLHAQSSFRVRGDFLFSFSSSSGVLGGKKCSVAIFIAMAGFLLAGSRRGPQNVSQLRLRVSQLDGL